jgi:hypothetical protein
MCIWGKDVKYKQNFVRNLEVKDHLTDYGRTILKYTKER